MEITVVGDLSADVRRKFNVEDFEITGHALRRFSERWVKSGAKEKLINPLCTLQELLVQSKRKRLGVRERLSKILDNDCVRAKYWRNAKWQFVIVEDEPGKKTLVTVTLI